MKTFFKLATAGLALAAMARADTVEEEEGGTFEGGFEINDYIDERNNPYFQELAMNITIQNGGFRNRDPRLRNARNELAPIDFTALQASDPELMASTRKFKHVAGLIMFLQAVPILGKYVYYGCYCFADAQYELDAGHGKPQDPIDSACKRFHQCYRCVQKDFVEEKQQVTFLQNHQYSTLIRLIAMVQDVPIGSKELSIQLLLKSKSFA